MGATLYFTWYAQVPTNALERNEQSRLTFPADTPDRQRAVLEKALAFHAKDRYQTVADFLEALNPMTDSTPAVDTQLDQERVRLEAKAKRQRAEDAAAKKRKIEEAERQRAENARAKKRKAEEAERQRVKNAIAKKRKAEQQKIEEAKRKKSYTPYILGFILLLGGIGAIVFFKSKPEINSDEVNVIRLGDSLANDFDTLNTQPKKTEYNLNMVHIEGGTFTMGCTSEQSNCESDEKPSHPVTLSSFYMSKYEVTQKFWREVMGSDPPELRFKGCDNCPVESVSWNDIQDFISKLNQKTGKNYRLPTEAEWEFAARGGTKSRGYKYAGSNDMATVAWYRDNSNSKTHPVGKKKANELGLYDMSGNVREWCSDWKRDYSSGSQTNPRGPSSGEYRILRGGSWNYYARYCRLFYRFSYDPSYRYGSNGFRLVSSS